MRVQHRIYHRCMQQAMLHNVTSSTIWAKIASSDKDPLRVSGKQRRNCRNSDSGLRGNDRRPRFHVDFRAGQPNQVLMSRARSVEREREGEGESISR